MMMTEFADSTEPGAINPAEFSHVAAYANGRFRWTDAQVARFPAHIKIGVLSGSPSQAAVARVLDIERFDAIPADFPPFAKERLALGHKDATAYCDLSTLPAVIEHVAEAMLKPGTWRLWLAWWWLRPFPPTSAEVLAEIRVLYPSLAVPTGSLWACQWQNGQHYDSSVLYGRNDFTRSA